MKSIIRGSIDVRDRVVVPLPRGAKIIKIMPTIVGQDPSGNPIVQVLAWIEADNAKPIEYRTFTWVATGGNLPIENYQYFDTIVIGTIELHLYELPGAAVDMTAVAAHQQRLADAGKPSLITRG